VSDLYNYDTKADNDNSVLDELWTGQEEQQEPDIDIIEIEAAISKLNH